MYIYMYIVCIYASKKFWRTLIWRLQRQTTKTAKFNSPPIFQLYGIIHATSYVYNVHFHVHTYAMYIYTNVHGCNSLNTFLGVASTITESIIPKKTILHNLLPKSYGMCTINIPVHVYMYMYTNVHACVYMYIHVPV